MYITKDEVAEIVRIHVFMKYRKQKNAAKAWGCSPAFVSRVCCGKRKPSKDMLKEIGLEEITVWRKVK